MYAMGAVMCRAITGEKPPVAADRIVDDDFIWLSNRGLTEYDGQFLTAVDWALRVRPEGRPQQIADWEPHLAPSTGISPPGDFAAREEIRVGLPVADPPEKRTSPEKPRNKSAIIAAIIATAAIGSVVAAMYGGHVKESARTAAAAEEAREQAAKSAIANRIAKQAEAARQESDRKAAEARAAALKEAEARKNATKDAPYENSLGMKFVPVPGTDVLFSIWDTRVRDYAVFARETGASITSPDFPQTPNDPVVNVSWEEAQAFCKWLTEKERSKGKIGNDDAYRLPTDAEWSAAVGTTKFPWGNEWPPPIGVGNYAPGVDVRAIDFLNHLGSGEDSFEYTSPVGYFPANRLGLYDMGGNVWQWCEDWYRGDMNETALLEKDAFLKHDGGGRIYRVVRGASWFDGNFGPEGLWSSVRLNVNPDSRNSHWGFRCVLGSSR